MKTNKLIYFLLFSLFMGFYSCNSDDDVINNDKDTDAKTIRGSEIAEIIANMQDTTVYSIDMEGDLNVLCQKISDLREQELTSKGYTKIETDKNSIELRASVQSYSVDINPMGARPIEYSQFKAKFSSNFCNEINAYVSNDYKISPSKTYICGWRDAGTYHNLASNQRGGTLPSPKAALIPSSKYGYSERGYEAYVNAHNQFIMVSHQLAIVCEDVNHTTILLDIRYPLFGSPTGGYVINYSILTL